MASTTRSAVFLPEMPWLWGGNPRKLFELAELRFNRGREGWSVSEKYSPFRLVQTRQVSGPIAGRAQLSLMADLPQEIDRPSISSPEVSSAIERLTRRLDGTSDLAALLSLIQLQLMNADAGAPLVDACREAIDALKDVGVEGERGQHPFADAGLQLVTYRPALNYRLLFPKVLLRMIHDKDQVEDPVGAIQRLSVDGEISFRSSNGLSEGHYLGDVYMSPLLYALTPSVWAVPVHRTRGALVITLGTAIAGTAGEASEMLQLLPSRGAESSGSIAPLPRDAPMQAVSWWNDRLSDMFQLFSGLSNFRDALDKYDPHRHLQAVMTIEQVFSRVGSCLAAARDGNARRVLLFTVLDSLERLTRLKIEVFCNLHHAEAVYSRLVERIPLNIAPILLPGARRGVDALRRVQAGFFIGVNHGQVLVRQRDSSERLYALDDATAIYLKILRDATHGHGTTNSKRRGITEALLAQHDGEIPHDLGLLSWLYLLDWLTDPALMARITTGGR